jgi:hypothetical protein
MSGPMDNDTAFSTDDERVTICATYVEEVAQAQSINKDCLNHFWLEITKLKKFFKMLQQHCIASELRLNPSFKSLSPSEHNLTAKKWATEIRRQLIRIGLCGKGVLGKSSTVKKNKGKKRKRHNSASGSAAVRPKWLDEDGKPLFSFGYTLEMFRERFKKAFIALRKGVRANDTRILVSLLQLISFLRTL